ncbi:hypothetical protein D3C72_2022460 [compost metagenome]
MLFCALNLAVSNITNWPNIEVSPLITLIIFRAKFMARSMILQYKDKPVTSGKFILPGFNWHAMAIQNTFTAHVRQIDIAYLFSPTTHIIQLNIRLLTSRNSRIGFRLPKCSSP